MPDDRASRVGMRRAAPKVLGALLAVGTAAALSGCGSPRPTNAPENLACGLDKNGLIVEDSFVRVFTASQARPRPMGAAKPPFTVLSLSAGGEFGAYGAAFLGGWASIGPSAVPVARSNVQVVTGVSTGSMIATHAFLGEEATVEKIFRELSGKDVYSERSKLSLLTANSLLEADGKDRIIATVITRGGRPAGRREVRGRSAGALRRGGRSRQWAVPANRHGEACKDGRTGLAAPGLLSGDSRSLSGDSDSVSAEVR